MNSQGILTKEGLRGGKVIILDADDETLPEYYEYYSKIIWKLLKKFFQHPLELSNLEQQMPGALPLMTYEKMPENAVQYSIRLLCKLRPGAGRFFYDMTSRWLIPNKKITTSLFFVSDFKLFHGGETYTASEIIILLNDKEDEHAMLSNIKALKKEILLGVQSRYLASRILEIKGLTSNEKVAYIHERVAHLVRRIPSVFDYDIFAKMQHFLVTTTDEFKMVHDYRHMSRIIYVLYLFQRKIQEKISILPDSRHLLLKLIPLRLRHPLGIRRALGIFVGLNFLKEHEVFEKRHIIKAVLKTRSFLNVLEDSFFVDEQTDEKISILYLEIEKEDGTAFSLQEIKKIQRKLPNQIKSCIEHLLRPVFMPRNEEEIMKNLLLLSAQLKYVKDLPQVMISFDEQTDQDLFFTVIIARVLVPSAAAIGDILQRKKSKSFQFAIERVRKTGKIRKKYPKEASVVRVRLPSLPFLREDLSLDLYGARQKVVEALQEIFGDVRDFNGGMIAKQRELFDRLKSSLSDGGQKDKLLLENFFHSIFPVEQRSVLSDKNLKELFLMLKSFLEESGRVQPVKVLEKEDGNHVLMILMEFNDLNLKQRMIDHVKRLMIPSRDLAVLHMQVYESVYLGYIYFFETPEKKRELQNGIKQVLDF
ncbi:MAG: hypothetical protein Tsb0015_09930 [Simkaniaceae bacterium]